MAQYVDQNSSTTSIVRHPPGHLLAPFGWAADVLGEMAKTEPKLLIHLFELDVTRMHLIALVLAHLNKVTPDLGRLLAGGSARAVTKQILGRCPTGIKRALGRLPRSVMAPENYRRLVEILADPKAAKLLFLERYIHEFRIANLYSLPAPLRRPFILHALSCHDQENRFSDGLRFLVSRGAASSIDAIVRDLATASKARQFFLKLKLLAERLPLRDALPPVRIGKARRIDQAAAIRTLETRWGNRLANYIEDINAGTCAIYVWENSRTPATCCVQRIGRFGWILCEVKGPRNAYLESKELAKIHSAFSKVGIPDYLVIAAMRCMIDEVSMD